VLFRDLIIGRASNPTSAVHPLFVVAFLCLLLEPLLSGNYGLSDTTTKTVFAFTGIAVAIHEEVVFRGVLQNLLEQKSGRVVAVVISSAVFTLYHYGAQPFTPLTLVSLFAAGCMLGLLYSVTGSLVLVIGIHALDDAVWAFSPFLAEPLPQVIGVGFMLFALLATVAWTLMRSNTALKRDAA
jgi:membrane protease YdiL (CAAX protease family)